MTSKNYRNISPSQVALMAACGALILALGKLILFFFSGSLIIALSAWDSCMDVIVSLINRKIVHFARLDADHNHPYGHGRAESIAALGQGSLIVGGAIIVSTSSIKELWNVYYSLHDLSFTKFGISYFIFFLCCAAFSYLITIWLRHFGKFFNSPALLADSQHYHVDFLTNGFTAVSLAVIAYFKSPLLDPIFAFLFSLYIAFGGFQLVRSSVHELMDHDIPESVKKDVLKLIYQSADAIIDVHNFRGRKSGHRYFFDFHITLPTHYSFLEVHTIIDKIEAIITKKYDGDVVIHPDPESIREKHSHETR